MLGELTVVVQVTQACLKTALPGDFISLGSQFSGLVFGRVFYIAEGPACQQSETTRASGMDFEPGVLGTATGNAACSNPWGSTSCCLRKGNTESAMRGLRASS